MTRKFKVGDRVRAIRNHDGKSIIDKLGTVKYLGSYIGVEFDENIHGHELDGSSPKGTGWNVADDCLELISSVSKVMTDLNKLTEQQEARLSIEDKALLEAGLINSNLTPTAKGLEWLNATLFEKNRVLLAKKAEKEVTKAKAEVRV